MIKEPKHIILSRTDSIGDVILSLPMAGVLKRQYPNVRISFLGKTYTQSIIEQCADIDQFVNFDHIKDDLVGALKDLNADSIVHVFPNKEIARAAKKAHIYNRVGTSHRLFHWWTCNHRPSFSRKNSELHESQLNLKLLAPFGIHKEYSIDELVSILNVVEVGIEEDVLQLIDSDRYSLIMHPLSQGSAREWGLEQFDHLATELGSENFQIFISGTKEDGDQIRNRSSLLENENVVDITGRFTLKEFVGFISKVDGLLACSTGPLHIAGVNNVEAVGLFSPIRPIHPGRWRPIGEKIKVFEAKNTCSNCLSKEGCDCLSSISVEEVKNYFKKMK